MESLRKFLCPEFVFGSGALTLCAQYANHMGASRVFVVSDEGVRAAGWTDKVLQQLDEQRISYELYTQISPNPRDSQVMEGASFYKQTGCDVILAVGGGSVLDAAKGVGIVVSNGGHILDYEGVDAIPLPTPPLICLPTTCGSSADVSQFAIITNSAEKRKIAIISKSLVPDIALVDPETLKTMDRGLMAAVSLDTLTHAVEAYVSVASSFMTERHALGAISLLGRNFIPAMEKPQDIGLLTLLMQASLEAGLAFSNASLGLVHAMAHVLGGLKDFPHGMCNGLLLKNVSAYNYEASPTRFDDIVRALEGIPPGGDVGGIGMEEALEPMLEASGIRSELSRFRLSPEECGTLAGLALKDACVVTNPRKPAIEEVSSLFEKTFG